MGREFPLIPREVPHVSSAHRRISTPIPVPASIPRFERLRKYEPASMGGQPPILWHEGEGCAIRDPYGNQWIDFSAGVLVAATGYGQPAVVNAMARQLKTGLYHTYCFANEPRIELVEKLSRIAPPPLEKVFLLSTGSEATECAMKLARTHAIRGGHRAKAQIVTFENAFHGRTLGAQLAGGTPGLKDWIAGGHPEYVQVPYPDGFRTPDTSFDLFERTLEDLGVSAGSVCAVMSETYQGCNAQMFPVEYAKRLRQWCDRHGALLIFDEIQAAFGRTGTMFGFEHLGIVPDLISCGKGISGGMPLSAVIGRSDVMDLYGPGQMTSTHTANPVCCAATLANLQVLEDVGAVENARRLGSILADSCRQMQSVSHGRIGQAASIGLVAALQFVVPRTTTPDHDMAWEVVRKCVESGVMLFAPVGVGGGAIKINPPLIITEAPFREGLEVVQDAVRELCGKANRSVVSMPV
jgi:4-aminobutyrate aminotransferase/diaminobutyrate-pyruvate transaminase/4-aminobutyrate aminotransferase/(S)-3-amino-2-methylpropionate transaminase